MFYDKSVINKVCAISIVDYLGSLGIAPARTSGKSIFYNLRNEKTASCSVFGNRFNDFGSGAKGNIIDLVQYLHACNFTSAVEILLAYEPTQIKSFSFTDNNTNHFISEGIEIKKVKKLENRGLLDYLAERKIPYSIASYYLQEAYFSVNGKPSKNGKDYFALAFKNEIGGHELRNKYFKGCSSKYYSLIRSGNENSEIAVFEGFIDFLSALKYFQVTHSKYDVLVLNSTTTKEQALPLLQKYQTVHLFLDNDSTGIATAKYFGEQHTGIINRSNLYSNYKDFNELVMR
jgi:DNA primase